MLKISNKRPQTLTWPWDFHTIKYMRFTEDLLIISPEIKLDLAVADLKDEHFPPTWSRATVSPHFITSLCIFNYSLPAPLTIFKWNFSPIPKGPFISMTFIHKVKLLPQSFQQLCCHISIWTSLWAHSYAPETNSQDWISNSKDMFIPFAFLNSSTASGFSASNFCATSMRDTKIFRSSVWNCKKGNCQNI